ncbi:MAG: LysR family transcriptional regulator [Rhizobiales bacterium]|nr:LysR family transcriptional regulator [Hyphomicrobiales bacterium]
MAVHGSMNAAAGELKISAITVGRRIRALEETLAVPLFSRGANALTLTDAGRAILEAAAPMGRAGEAVPRIAAAFRDHRRAPIRITATTSMTMFLSRHAPLLATAAAPFEVAFLPTRRALDLAGGEADIALRMQKLPEQPDLFARRIGRAAFAVFDCAAQPSKAAIGPPDDRDLSRQNELIALVGRNRPVAARIGDMPIRYQAVKSGLGIGVLPCWLGDSDPALVRLHAPRDSDIEDVFLVTHRRVRARPEVMRVAKALTDLFKAHRGILEGSA